MSFGGWRRDYSFQEIKDENLIQYSPLAEVDNQRRPLISKLLRIPLYRKIYLAHMKTIVNDFLKNGQLMTIAQNYTRSIDPWVKQDSLKLYGYADFQNAFDKSMKNGPDNVIGIRQLMDKRSTYLNAHILLTKPTPTLSDGKHTKEGSKIKFNVKVSGTKTAWLYIRRDKAYAFNKIVLFDDGTNGDAIANDGIFSTLVDATIVKQYYFVAEGEEAAALLPERASQEFFKVD
jgi:hypothetical protein